ncbi:uncharacterized protein PRCAT00001570001 [Priceomyces carsonii]|uniref:uncharacterized protein n=1 Tax=Priceomyces carsonii TaxID=28549 RepID=UPI002ED7ECF4|nr:unnamed protein product [Priceomyces carsonii]
MKTKTLYDFIKLQDGILNVPLRHDVYPTLVNQSCHFLFSSRELKLNFIEQIKGKGTVLLNCGQEEYCNNGPTIIRSVSSFENLLLFLQSLLTEYLDYELRNLVIDNISVFYWELKVLHLMSYKSIGYRSDSSNQSYKRFLDLLEQLKEKFKCNIVITSWDVTFDKGYNYKGKEDIVPKDISSLSYLSPMYLFWCDYILHADDYSDKYFDKTNHRWVVIGKENN